MKLFYNLFKISLVLLNFIRISVESNVLASGHAAGEIKLWNLSDYSCIKILHKYESEIFSLQLISKSLLAIGTNKNIDI